jgi:polysaccharide export outer membrane protein
MGNERMTVKRIPCLGFIGLLAALLFGCATQNPTHIPEIAVAEEVTAEGKSFSFDKPSFNIFTEYRVAPGDQLDVLFEIRTWQVEADYKIALDDVLKVNFVHAPELDEEQKIRPDGKISLPYIGSYYAAGKTIKQIDEELTERYAKILIDPDIYVTVPEYLTQLRELKEDLHTAPRGLSRLVTVRPDGFATFPMVGDVFVAGKTMAEVQEYVDPQYNEISRSLHVTIFLEEHAGSMVYVMGMVNRPGAHKIVKPITVLEAITLAEGLQPNAELSAVAVFRRVNKKVVGRRIDVSSTLAMREGGTHFFLAPDDIVYVPETRLSGTANIMDNIRRMIMFRGWGVNIDTGNVDINF